MLGFTDVCTSEVDRVETHPFWVGLRTVTQGREPTFLGEFSSEMPSLSSTGFKHRQWLRLLR